MKSILLVMLTIFCTNLFATAPPTLIFKNQFGEQTNANILGGTFTSGNSPIAANTILSNLTGSSATPVGNTYSAVSVKLLPTQLLTGFTSGGGVVAGTDTVIQGLQKLAGNVAAHQANSTAPDVATLVTDFNALLAKLQAAHLMN